MSVWRPVTYAHRTIANESHVTLRLTYNPSNQTLYSSYRIPPATTWTDFEEHGLYGISPQEFAKGFILELSTVAEPSFLLTQDQANFDNFSASLAPPVAPAPLANGLRANVGQFFTFKPEYLNRPYSFSASTFRKISLVGMVLPKRLVLRLHPSLPLT